MGIPAADARIIDGRFVSKMTPGLKRFKGHPSQAKNFFNHPDVLDGFIMDCWLGNWNVFGLQNEYVRKQGDRMVRTSNQGSLLFRANGGHKPQFNNTHVSELASMTDPSKGAGKIFNGLIDDNKTTQQVQKLQKVMSDETIREVVQSSGISDSKKIIETLIKRRNWLIEQFLED